MQHSFNVNVAIKYGVNQSIILNNLYFWIEKNRANEKHFHDGYYWTYNNMKAFSVLFPYMTERQIDYAIKKLVDEGLVIKGNYNKSSYDRTCWYAITKEGYSVLKNCEIEETKAKQSILQNCEMDSTKAKPCISQNCEMDFTNLSNGFHTIVSPIPDINTDNKTNNIYKKEKNSKKEKSYLSLDSTPTEENFHTPMEENFQDNNTVINNTVINIKNKKEKNSKKEKNEINEQKQEYELLELKRVKETVIQKVENVSLQKKILNFLNFRIKNKKPVTIEYIRVFLEKLDKLSNFNDNEKIEILNQSIERGYTTIYAVNKNSNFNFNRYNKTISTPESYDTSEYEIITSSEDYLDNAMDLL